MTGPIAMTAGVICIAIQPACTISLGASQSIEAAQ